MEYVLSIAETPEPGRSLVAEHSGGLDGGDRFAW